MNVTEIIREICGTLQRQFPEAVVYEDLSDDSFQRPSFFVEFVSDEITQLTASIWQYRLSFAVNILLPLDQSGLVDQMETMTVISLVSSLFERGFIEVSGRRPHVYPLRGTIENGAGRVELEVTYQDGRNALSGYSTIGELLVNGTSEKQ